MSDDYGRISLDFGRVLHVLVSCQYLLIGSHDLCFMSLNVGDSGLDIIRREAEEAGNLIIAPTLLVENRGALLVG
jgi:hypothetical protein